MNERCDSMKKTITLILSFMIAFSIQAQDTLEQIKPTKNPSKVIAGFIDPNIYYDTRNRFDFTLNALAGLPHRFQYFTFSNYSTSNETSDLSNFYSEHHLYWGISNKSPFDLLLQVMILSGEQNDAFRIGLRWRIGATQKLQNFFTKIGLTYNIALHGYQLDADNHRSPWLAQIEHFYRLTLFKNRIYISGFADQDIYYNSPKIFAFVAEHQLGIRMIDNLFFVAEYRLNDYLPAKKTGVGLGLEYFIKL